MNKGFTLVEILVAVMILAVLVTMAFPLYEQAIEKSRISDVRTTLKKLHESKMRILDSLDKQTYSTDTFGFENLDFSLPCSEGTKMNEDGTHVISCSTKDFTYFINPVGEANAVCAVRRTGDYKGANFLYLGDLETNASKKFKCNNGSKWGSCEAYGLSNTDVDKAWCSL